MTGRGILIEVMKNRSLFYFSVLLGLFFLLFFIEIVMASAIEKHCVKIAEEKVPDNPITYYPDPNHPNQLTFRNNRYIAQIECENSYIFRPVLLPVLNLLFP